MGCAIWAASFGRFLGLEKAALNTLALGGLLFDVELANDHKTSVGLVVVVVDINGFSRLNATHGFDIGDAILKELALRLAQVARLQDYAARIGDNRFALIPTRIVDTGHVDLAVRKLFRSLDPPFEFGGLRFKVAVTVGAALCPAHASQADHLLRQAERHWKRRGRASCRTCTRPTVASEEESPSIGTWKWSCAMPWTAAR